MPLAAKLMRINQLSRFSESESPFDGLFLQEQSASEQSSQQDISADSFSQLLARLSGRLGGYSVDTNSLIALIDIPRPQVRQVESSEKPQQTKQQSEQQLTDQGNHETDSRGQQPKYGAVSLDASSQNSTESAATGITALPQNGTMPSNSLPPLPEGKAKPDSQVPTEQRLSEGQVVSTAEMPSQELNTQLFDKLAELSHQSGAAGLEAVVKQDNAAVTMQAEAKDAAVVNEGAQQVQEEALNMPMHKGLEIAGQPPVKAAQKELPIAGPVSQQNLETAKAREIIGQPDQELVAKIPEQYGEQAAIPKLHEAISQVSIEPHADKPAEPRAVAAVTTHNPSHRANILGEFISSLWRENWNSAGSAKSIAEASSMQVLEASRTSANNASLSQNGAPFMGGATRLDRKPDHEDLARPGRSMVRPNPERILERVDQALKEAARSKDGSSISMRLDPPQLGSIRVDLSIKDGTLHARLVPESAAVLQILRERAHELHAGLRQLGLDVDKVTVSVGGESYSSAGRNSGAELSSRHDMSDGSESERQDSARDSNGTHKEERENLMKEKEQVLDHWVA